MSSITQSIALAKRISKACLLKNGQRTVMVQQLFISNPEIGIDWPQVVGEYKETARVDGYTLKDGTLLKLSRKDQKWRRFGETLKFKE